MFSSSYHRATKPFFSRYSKADVITVGSSCLFHRSPCPEDALPVLHHCLDFFWGKPPPQENSLVLRGCSETPRRSVSAPNPAPLSARELFELLRS